MLTQKMLEEALSVQLWALSADILILWLSFVYRHCSCVGAFYPCQILSTLHISLCVGWIRLLLFTLWCPWLRLHSLVAWLRAFGIGRPAPPWLSTAISLGSLGGRRRREATLERRNGHGCSGPDIRVGTSRLGRRDFRTLQTTFPMN